jgi:hypothetical protein
MTRVVLGTAAVTSIGRAIAAPNAPSARQEGCATCQFYAPASGAAGGTCAFTGKTVDAGDGCGEFSPRTGSSTDVSTAARP